MATDAIAWRRRRLLSEFMVFLALCLAPLPSIDAILSLTKCEYALQVKTSCRRSLSPGTTAPVKVRIRDEKGNEVFVKHLGPDQLIDHLGNKTTPLKDCIPPAVFGLRGSCLKGKVCLMHFMVESTSDNWVVDDAILLHQNGDIDKFQITEHPMKAWFGHNSCKGKKDLASSAQSSASHKHVQGHMCNQPQRRLLGRRSFLGENSKFDWVKNKLCMFKY